MHTHSDPCTPVQTDPAEPRACATMPGPRLRTGPVGIGIRVVVTIAILFVANAVSLPVYSLLGAWPWLERLASEPTWAALGVMTAMQGCVCGFAILCVWLWVRFIERRRLRDIGLRFTATSLLWALLGIVVAAGMLLGIAALLSRGGAPAGELPFSAGTFAVSLGAVLVQGFVLQAIPEEVLFRGMLLSSLRQRPVLAIAVSTLAFTVIHLVSNGGQQSAVEHILYLMLPLGFSLLGIGLLLWTRSLWAAVGVHGGLHLGNALSQLMPEFDQALSWVLIGGVYTVVRLALIVPALRQGRGIPNAASEWR